MNTYEPMDASKLSYQERKYALDSMLFITEKRNSDVKARNVVIGIKNRTYDRYNKSNGSYPTVNTDSVFLTGVVDAHERRAVAILDIQNGFLHSENDEYVLMLLRGKLSELLVKVDPSLYRKYIITSKQGVSMLYVKLTKDLYGMLRSAMLFYKKLRGHLEGKVFEVNPYDPCVANKLVNGSQMTVCWHVDDLKISHIEEDAITDFCTRICGIFGNGTKIARGKVHEYLGMDMDWNQDGTMIVSMIKYLQKVIDNFPEIIRSTAVTPASEHLFQMQDEKDRKLLPEEQAKHFHHTFAQLLFLCMRA